MEQGMGYHHEQQLAEDIIDNQQDVDTLHNNFAQFELPLVEYARLHGLTDDCLSNDPFQSDLLPVLSGDWEAELEDSGPLTTIGLLLSLGALNGRTAHEKLDIDKDAAELLAFVIRLGQDDECLNKWEGNCSLRLKDLKLEEPILSSDPELDLLRLKRRNMAKICADCMVPFPPETIQDPGFLSPEKDAAMRQVVNEIGSEKLDIDRPTIDYLGDTCKQLQDKDDNNDIDVLMNIRKTRYPSPETPPLLTSSPFLQAEASALQVPEMELTSSPEDLIQQEAMQVERKILAEESTPPSSQNYVNPQHEESPSMYENLQDDSEYISSPLQRKRLKDLKVEVPLTPEDSIERPMKKLKTVSFAETLQTLIPPLGSDMVVSEGDLDDVNLENFIQNVVEPFAESALKQIEEEQLDELDTTLRVIVPRIDDFETHVPWEATSDNQTDESGPVSQRRAKIELEYEFDDNEKKWSGVQRIERQLPWTPFPAKLGKVDTTEELDDADLAVYLAELDIGHDLDIESLVRTSTRPKLLQDEDENFFVEPGEPIDSDDEEAVESFVPQKVIDPTLQTLNATNTPATIALDPVVDVRLDMQALLRKRKSELEAAHNKPAPSPATISASTPKPYVTAMSKQVISARPTRFSDLSMAGGGLANFLNLHGGPPPTDLQPKRVVPQEQQVPPAPVMTFAMGYNFESQAGQRIEIPSPQVSYTRTAFSMIVSPAILANRDLMRELRNSFPAVEIVTRDLLPPKSSEAAHAVNSEADITLSPSTGIISTTLQKVKQMPLPGQTGFFGVRDRITSVSRRYKRLLVLVSEGRRQEEKHDAMTGPLDSRDIRTISDLVSFTASQENAVEVYFIAGGDPQLMTWLAAGISRTAVLDDSVNLMQDESIWERMLRQSGLNAYAAQYVLSKLKLKAASSGGESSSFSEISSTDAFGLAALSQMAVSQRIDMFRDSVGEKVIARMSAALDATFIPAMKNPGNQIRQ